MAHFLDPKDIPHLSSVPDKFAHTRLHGLPGRRQVVAEPSLPAVRYQSEPADLDEFDRNILRSIEPSNHFDSNNGLSRLSIPLPGTFTNPAVPKTAAPSIYGRQMTQQQLEEEKAYLRTLRANATINRPQRTYTAQHEPTAIYHGVENINTAPPVYQAPTTPLNLARFAYHTPGNIATSPPSGNESSSPSARISLRRLGNRASAPKRHKTLQPGFGDEFLPSCQPVRQNSADIVSKLAQRHFPTQTPTVQGIQLVSPHELPDRFRQVFPYELFNAVQSKCFAPIYATTDNVVVAAPTGSGKTAILELAICKLVQDFGSEQFKIVYQAPTKSLCSERVRDWQKKFTHLNLPCVELTGDTDNFEMRKVGNAAIIITTPEKWDSITRKWKDHIKLLQLVKLFLIDEVHILKDPRGATLEAVVSRMKSIGTNVRFIALSATVPNPEDVAAWLGKDHTNGHLPAHRETFGEEFRPVKLQRHVYGFSANINDFAFDTFLDTKLPNLIVKHTIRKPMMIFCVTRKICESTATKLAQWWSTLRVTERPWPVPQQKITVGSPELRELVGCGVAFHHAGLDAQDRIAVETGFLRDGLSVICCTSTLAVGVNLPCHLVVIKNTVCYKDTGLSEYSDLEVMQMLGRAGRPQFDDSATAIIMTRSENIDRYNRMVSGQEILESTLHLNLIEHLNSEIGLGTVHDVYSAKRWLAGTFLSVRMRKNPSYYKFSSDTGSRDADERLEGVCERDIELLKSHKLISEDQRFMCTEYGQAMAKYMVQFETMKSLLSIPKNAKMTQILQIVSKSSEFKDLRFKPNERASYREFNKSPFIKSPIKESISTFAHKVSLIIQVHLGGVELPMDKEFNIIKRQFQSEKSIVFERIIRLIRCVVECKAYECDAVATCNALELLRSIAAGFWENSTLQLRQLPTIGPAAVRKLVQSNVKTIGQLAAMDSAAIERVMSRNPPFGKKIIDVVTSFPRLTLQTEIKKKIIKIGESVKVQVNARLGYSNAKLPGWNRKVPTVTFTASISDGTLAHIWRGSLKRLEKGFDLTFTCELSRPTDIIICQHACEEIVGTIQSVELRPDIAPSAFPPPKPNLPSPKKAPEFGRENKLPSLEAGAETIVVLEQEEEIQQADPGSDYGGGSIFDDFVDIDDLELIAAGDDDELEASVQESVRMENGRWRCKHKCRDAQGNYLNKNGAPCKHLCCREGVDKPRRLQKKKVTEGVNVPGGQENEATEKKTSNFQKKSSKNSLKLTLKRGDRDLSFNDIEEIDLADEPIEAEEGYRTPRQYPSRPSMLSIEKISGPVRISRKAPQFSYAQGLQPDLSLIGQLDDDDRRSPDFPLPSILLGNQDLFEDDLQQDAEILPPLLADEGLVLPADQYCTPPNGSLETEASGFNGFEALETAREGQNLNSNKRRAFPPSPMESETKHRRIGVKSVASEPFGSEGFLREGKILNGETKSQLPGWVAEFDQDLVAFFGDSVEYKD